MPASPRRFAAALALLALAACTGGSDAATVAGSAIADEDVALAAGVFRSLSALTSTPCGAPEGEGDTVEAACSRFSLGALIGFSAAEDYAEANGLEVTDDELTETAESFAESFGEGSLEAALEEEGVAYDAFLEVLRGSMIQREAAVAMVEATVSEDELHATYEAELGDHVIVQADHILVATEEEAEAVYEQVTAPGATREDFLALADEVSTDPSVTENHGSLPSITVSQLPPSSKAFADTVLEMEEGDISRPVQTDFGWHVIHMQSKDVTPYEEVRDDLVGQLADPAFADHERALLEDGSIEVNPRFGRLDPQSLTVLRITSTDPVGATPTGPVNVAPEG